MNGIGSQHSENRLERMICENNMDTVSDSRSRVVFVSAAGRQTALWLIVVLLAVIATIMITRWDEVALLRATQAQSVYGGGGSTAGARGIFAFTGQLDAKTYGLFMLDIDTGTVWCYELARNQPGSGAHLKLVAARSWIFDRYLEEFNVAAPTPAEVRQLVEQQQANRQALDKANPPKARPEAE